MEPIKKSMIGAVALATVAAIFAGLKFSAAAKINEALALLNRQQEETAARIAELETRLQDETKHAQTVESDNALLADALKWAEVAQAEKTKQAAKPLTEKEVEDRFRHARSLVRRGDPSEVLRELLGCYEEFRRRGGNARLMIGAVIREIGTLGERYPEALAALRERRNALRQEVLAGPGGSDAVAEFSCVLGALKEDRSILELYDAMPPGDPRLTSLGIYGFKQLFEAQRYTDAARARSYGDMSSRFELINRGPRESVVKTTTDDIEVLAGAGDLDHARILTARLLAFDGSDETKALLKTRMARAGHPELPAPAP